jgi:hypothetical protein
MHVALEQRLVMSQDQTKTDPEDGTDCGDKGSRLGPSAEDIAAAIEWAHLGGD